MSQGNNYQSSVFDCQEIQDAKQLERIRYHSKEFVKYDKCESLADKSDLKQGWIYCEDCRRYRSVNPSCNLRNCPRCQAKQSRRLFRRYLPVLNALVPDARNNLRMVMLSGFRWDGTDLKAKCHSFFSVVEQYLKEIYQGGLITLEYTRKNGDLYVHAHALVYGGFKLRSDFGKEFSARLYEAGLITYWEMVKGYYQGQWYTWMTTARSKRGGLRYSLKYVSKGVLLSDDEVRQLRGLRFVRTFGIFRGIEGNNYRAVCADCGGKICVWFGDLSEWGPMDHPLKVKWKENVGPPP